MATVNFLYRSTKPEANLIARLLFRKNGTDYVHAAKTKFEVTKEYWNKKHNLKRPNNIEISNKQLAVNTELNKIEKHVLKAFNSVEVIEVSKEWLQAQIDSYYNPPKQKVKLSNKLTEYAESYIKYKSYDVKPRTLLRNKIAINKLKEFEKIKNRDFLIADVDTDFKNDFIDFYKGNGYAHNTIKKDFTIIKSICRHARNKEIETSKELDSLIIKEDATEKIYLSKKELEQIEKTLYESEALKNAKDWLLISCHTGQRVSDFLRFTKEMIRVVEDGTTYIDFRQMKTSKLMELPLHPKVVEILDKNNGNFPYKISDQRYNEYIKDVCKLAGITAKVQGGKQNPKTIRKESGIYPKYELVTSHIGRRSFATNNFGIVPTSILISFTGHSTEKMFLAYIGKTQNEQAKGMVKFW